MTTITNETILKAAKAAGLVIEKNSLGLLRFVSQNEWHGFNPLYNDTDNAMIRRGADIDVEWSSSAGYVEAVAYLPGLRFISYEIDYNNKDKGAAEREAVIICAAAKWDAMNKGEQK